MICLDFAAIQNLILTYKGHDAVVSLSDGQDGQPKIIIAILAVKLW